MSAHQGFLARSSQVTHHKNAMAECSSASAESKDQRAVVRLGELVGYPGVKNLPWAGRLAVADGSKQVGRMGRE